MLNEEEETFNQQWNEIKSSENDTEANGVVLLYEFRVYARNE